MPVPREKSVFNNNSELRTPKRQLPQVGRPLRVRSPLRRETLLQGCLTAHGTGSSALLSSSRTLPQSGKFEGYTAVGSSNSC